MANTSVESDPIYSSLAADPCLSELVEMYVDETPARIAALEQAFSSGDRAALRSAAHQMKGAAGSYGFDRLTLSAGILEAAIRTDQSPETVERALDDLIRLCRSIRAGVEPRNDE